MIDVILPCLDEAAALPWVLTHMPDGYRPIVADNGSADGSAGIARAYGAEVVDARPRGFGAACHAGLLAARSDVVCVMDADASLDPRELSRVTEPVLDGRADLVLGRRVPATRTAWPAHARLANRLLAARLRRRTGAVLHDLGPMRAFRRTGLLGLALTDRRFGYPLEMVVRAAADGWRITETDVTYLPRTGRSKVTGTVRGTARAVADMRRVLADGGEPPGAWLETGRTHPRRAIGGELTPSGQGPPGDTRSPVQYSSGPGPGTQPSNGVLGITVAGKGRAR